MYKLLITQLRVFSFPTLHFIQFVSDPNGLPGETRNYSLGHLQTDSREPLLLGSPANRQSLSLGVPP